MQSRHVSSDRAVSAREATRVATPAELAWLASIPCALGLLGAIVLLGPSLGHALFEPQAADFWPFWRTRFGILPEPSEHAAYLLAILAPVALSSAVVLGAARGVALPPATIRTTQPLAQALVPCALAACLITQHAMVYGYPYTDLPARHVYFTRATLAVAALITLGLVVALRTPAVVARVRGWAHETRVRRRVALLLAVALTALWVSTAINSDSTIINGHFRIFVNIPFFLDEPFAVLNGRTPLVDFNTQYGHLLAYVVAAPLALLGPSLGTYTVIMATGSGLAMLAVFAVLRRVVGRSLIALALYVPALSTSFFTELGPLAVRHGPQTLFSVFPLRYLGAYAMAWLTARQLDGAAPRRRPLLFVLGGLVLINNLEFGLPAFGATLVALFVADSTPSWSRVGRLLADALLGLLAAVVAVSLLTLAVGGSLPHFGMLLTFPRIYGVDGFLMMPMPKLGLHIAIYLTFAAALTIAVVRWVARAGEPLLTSMLAWSGVFGLGAAAYFVGRSLPEALVSIFSMWALAVVLLLVATVRAILSRPTQRPTLAEVAVMFLFGIAVCSIAQTPTPWSQVERLGDTSAARPYADPPAKRAIRAATSPGEHVVILHPLGHRIAYDLGLVNVSPYSFLEAMPLRGLLDETIAALRSAGGRKLFLPLQLTHPEQLDALRQAGFEVRDSDEATDVIELTDTTAAR